MRRLEGDRGWHIWSKQCLGRTMARVPAASLDAGDPGQHRLRFAPRLNRILDLPLGMRRAVNGIDRCLTCG